MIPNDKIYSRTLDNSCSFASLAVSLRTCQAFGMVNPRRNPDKNGHIYDLVFDYFGREVRVETEIKLDWKEDWSIPVCDPDVPYRWSTMDIPYRKRDKAVRHANWHHVVGGDAKRVFWVPRNIVLSSPVTEKFCRNRSSKEPFFNIQLPCPMSMFWLEIDNKWIISHRWDKNNKLIIKDCKEI